MGVHWVRRVRVRLEPSDDQVPRGRFAWEHGKVNGVETEDLAGVEIRAFRSKQQHQDRDARELTSMYAETLDQQRHRELIGELEKWTMDLVLELLAGTSLARLRKQHRGALKWHRIASSDLDEEREHGSVVRPSASLGAKLASIHWRVFRQRERQSRELLAGMLTSEPSLHLLLRTKPNRVRLRGNGSREACQVAGGEKALDTVRSLGTR
jgi:hypothetical protein